MVRSPTVVNEKSIEYDEFSHYGHGGMVTDKIWQDFARNLLKSEMKRRGMSYKDVAQKLTEAGTPDTAENLMNKVSRAGFSAAFLFQCLNAIGCKNISISPE